MRREDERGVALLVVVSLIAVLAAIAFALTGEVSRDLSHAQYNRAHDAAQRMAELGLNAGMMLLQYDYEEDKRSRKPVDYYFTINAEGGLEALADMAQVNEIWSLFRPGGDSPLNMLGMGNMLPIGEGAVEIVISDESSRYNVHRLLRGTGRLTPEDPDYVAFRNGLGVIFDDPVRGREVAPAIVDWMDADENPFDANGAENSYYWGQLPPYVARNGPFQDQEELRGVRGVDEAAYATLASAVTVWPNHLGLYSRYKVNVNTATPEALLLLDQRLDDTYVDRLIEERENEPFDSLPDVGRFFKTELNLPDVWNDLEKRYAVDVASTAFRIRATGYADASGGGDAAPQLNWAALEAVVFRDPKDGQLKVRAQRWRTFQEPAGE